MAKSQQRGNREAKKPKKEEVKVIAAASSQKGRDLAAELHVREEEIAPVEPVNLSTIGCCWPIADLSAAAPDVRLEG